MGCGPFFGRGFCEGLGLTVGNRAFWYLVLNPKPKALNPVMRTVVDLSLLPVVAEALGCY